MEGEEDPAVKECSPESQRALDKWRQLEGFYHQRKRDTDREERAPEEVKEKNIWERFICWERNDRMLSGRM